MVAHDEIRGLLSIKRMLQVLDVNNQSFKEQEEPSNKRIQPLARVTFLANLISPRRNGAVRHFGQTIQSFTLSGDHRSPASAQKSLSRSTVPTPTKRRSSMLWLEMLDIRMKESLTTQEIKCQEAIYELSRGEQDLTEALKLARKSYHDPMLRLSIMSEEELTHIFGDLDACIPLHKDLLPRIGEGTKPNGTVEQVGHILVNWLPGPNAYRGGQDSSGSEETRPKSSKLPPAPSGVSFRSKTRSLEFPRYPSRSPCQVPLTVKRNP